MISNKLLVALSFSTLLANSAFCSDINPAAENTTSPRTAITASEAPNPQVKQVSYQDAFKTYFSTVDKDDQGDEGTPPALMLMESTNPFAVMMSNFLKRIEDDRVKSLQERAIQQQIQEMAQKQKCARNKPAEYKTYVTGEIGKLQYDIDSCRYQMRASLERIKGIRSLLEIINNPSHPEYSTYAHHKKESLEERLREVTEQINYFKRTIESNTSFINIYNSEINLLLELFPALNIQPNYRFAH